VDPALGNFLTHSTEHVAFAVAIAQLLQWAKEADIPGLGWFSDDTKKHVKSIVGAVAAFLATAGIGVQFINPEPGAYGVLVTGLLSLRPAIQEFIVQWSLQQLAYEKLVKPTKPTPVAEVPPEQPPLITG
jgi:hypothetical protein